MVDIVTVPIVATDVVTTAQATTSVVTNQTPVVVLTAGTQGPAGPGVPIGGTAGQVLSKVDATDYNAQWVTLAAGAVPAGAAGQIQFTDGAGGLNAGPDLFWDAVLSHLEIGAQSGAGALCLFGVTADPAVEPNEVTVYAKEIAGRMLPKWKGPSGLDTPIQPMLAFNSVGFLRAQTGTTVTGAGSLSVTKGSGTFSTPTLATTNLLTSTKRINMTTGTTSGTVSSVYQNAGAFWRGNAAGLGGFFTTFLFATPTIGASQRAFCGVTNLFTAPTNIDPLANNTTGHIGMGCNTNTGNWQFVNKASSVAPTVQDLGVDFPINTTNIYELSMFCPPNGANIYWRVKNFTTGATVSGVTDANLPANTAFLAMTSWITNNNQAAARAMDVVGWYLESDT